MTINHKLQGHSMNMINKQQFRTLVQAFTKRITDNQCNDIFNFFTKRPESKL